jgi:two-component system, NtrC family, nitrogen regulation sensor histidine kinase GlnL
MLWTALGYDLGMSVFAFIAQLPHVCVLCDAKLQVCAQSNLLLEHFGGQSILAANLMTLVAGDARVLQAAHACFESARLHLVHDVSLHIERQRHAHLHMQAIELDQQRWLYLELQLDRTEAAATHALVRQMARAFAHEVRNPLSGLRGAAQLLARKTPEYVAYTDVVVQEADRIARLVDKLSGAPARAHVPINVHEIAERARSLCALQFPDQHWLRDYDPSLPEIAGDADSLTQALLNLLQNAAGAGANKVSLVTRVQHRLSIGEKLLRTAIRIDVHDDGAGVPIALRDQLFLPLVTGKSGVGGSGFGLAIVLAVAEEHGGSVRYRSAPGDTCFSIYLPAET